MKTNREFRITEFEAPTRIRWTETSTNLVTAEGGYDLETLSPGKTRVRLFNSLNGHGVGKMVAGVALNAARKDADAFGERIKKAVESS